MERKAYTIVKGLKKFKNLITNRKIIVMVAHPSVKEYIKEGDIQNKRANWITKILDYDIKINPTKLVRGSGLCQYLM